MIDRLIDRTSEINHDTAVTYDAATSTHNGIDYALNVKAKYVPQRATVYPFALKMLRECPRARMARYNAVMGTKYRLPNH
jgi:hypothetical protein